jgi:hypothetical protein
MTLVEVRKGVDRTFDKQLLQKYSRVREDYLWILRNKETLRQKYANKYIAVQNKTVEFVGDTIPKITAKIKQSGKQVEDYAIEYIGEHPVNFLF